MRRQPLQGCGQSLITAYDVGLLDLDGVVYIGDTVVPHAAQALRSATEQGWRFAFVTNNALRTPADVAVKLVALGIPASAQEVVTSAQAAARVLSQQLPGGSRVLVAGGEGLRAALIAVGLRPVSRADESPAAVVCGHDPEMTWTRLAEATLAIRAGLPWVASNTDATIPDSRGKLPGAGAIVALLSTACERAPDEVAGKPHPAMHAATIERTHSARPLVVGDRLDTDIRGARAAGVDSLLVLTGVTDAHTLVAARADERPTYIAEDLRGVLMTHPAIEVARAGRAAVGQARAHLTPAGELVVSGPDRLDRLRAACAASWSMDSPTARITGLG